MHPIMTVKKRMGDKLRILARTFKHFDHQLFKASQRCLHLVLNVSAAGS